MSGFAVCKLALAALLVLGVAFVVVRYRWGEDHDPFDDGDGIFWIVGSVLGLAILFVSIAWGATAGEGVSCKNNAADMGLPYRYGFSTSCKVLDDGRWIPIDQLINNRESSG